MYDVAHGAGLAALWGSWARYVYRDCLPRFVKFARTVMGVEGTSDEDTALKGIDIDAQPLEQIIRLALKNMVKP